MKREPNGAEPAAEIDKLEREIAATERTGLPLADLIAAAMRAFDDAAAFFAKHGFAATGYLPREREHYQMKAVRGALATIGGDKLRAIERTRIERQFKAAGGQGLGEAEREQRLAELHTQLRIAKAKRELAWRAFEQQAGELAERVDGAGELFLLHDADLQAIAAGTEVSP